MASRREQPHDDARHEQRSGFGGHRGLDPAPRATVRRSAAHVRFGKAEAETFWDGTRRFPVADGCESRVASLGERVCHTATCGRRRYAMRTTNRSRGTVTALAAVLLGAGGQLGTATTAAAQHGKGRAPLVLREQGSFFVGGHTIHTDAVSGTPGGLLGTGNGGSISVDQMYVQYQIPDDGDHHVPVVMLHGCCLSGKTYETTPDGRMGWGEYFVRKGRSVYIPDQVSRARSGFDATTVNMVRLGTQPASALPN